MRRQIFRSKRVAIRIPQAVAWSLLLRHLFALIALLMLPVPMQDGTAVPHQDALFELVLDANDGIIDHHIGATALAHAHEDPESAGHDLRHGETAAFGNTLHAHGGSGVLAIIVLLVLAFVLPTGDRVQLWPPPSHRWGIIPGLDPPPPRIAA